MSNPIPDEIFGLIILPLLIFFARIVDVSLQTLRIIFTSRDRIKIAPIVGFFEVFIWLLAIGQLFNNVTNILYYLAYASGFATGNYIGIYIERKLSISMLSLLLFLKRNPDQLLNSLKVAGYGLTTFTAQGKHGNVKMVVLIIKRKNLKDVLDLIEKNYPNAFISIEQVQSVKRGIFVPTIKDRKSLIRKKS
jgi:uncharacterized protein YebE (UPF0316 family)